MNVSEDLEADGAPVLRFREVSKAFGPKIIYEAMNLDIRRGETLAILGGSGQGKSVCLKLIIGILQVDSGIVEYSGRDVGAMNPEELRELRTEVSMVFQSGALFDSMNVLENVGYGLREHTRADDSEILERARECLSMVGLDAREYPNLLTMMPASLSGGMRKRVALARSIALEPKVILYDEPTTGLDPQNSTRISRMIRKLQRELGVTSIVVTHDMPLAWHVADRVAMLHEHAFPFIDDVEKFRAIGDPVVKGFIEGVVT